MLRDILSAIGAEPDLVLACEPRGGVAASFGDLALGLPPLAELTSGAINLCLQERPCNAVLVIPPFIKGSAEARNLIRPHELHEHVTISVARQLDHATSFAAILPRRSFSGGRSQTFRSIVAENFSIQWIIEFDDSSVTFPEIHSAMQFSLLVIGRPADEHVTRFARVPPSEPAARITGELRKLRRMTGGATTNGYVVRKRLTADSLWTYEAWNPALEQQRTSLSTIGRVIKLGEIASFPSTLRPTIETPHLRSSEENTDGARVVEGRSLQAGFTLADDFRYRTEAGQPLLDGDIVVRAIYGPNGTLNPVLIRSEMLPLVAAHSVVVVRLRSDLDFDDRWFLTRYLASDAVKPFVAAGVKGSLALHVTPSALAELPVPLADATLKQAMRELYGATKELEEWKREGDGVINELFSFSSIETSRPQLLSTGRRIRQRVRMAKAIDQPEARIRTTLPHPIAFRWRAVEAATPDPEGYQQVLEAAEIAVCYLAQLSLVAARYQNVELGSARQLAEKLAQRGHGTTMGDWVAIFNEVRLSREFRAVATEHPFFELIKTVPIDSAADRALRDLKRRRDDFAHQRGPRGAAIKTEFRDARSSLKEFLIGLEFLAEYPLRYIERARRDTFAGTSNLQYRDLMGDHPLVPLAEICVPSFDVEEESLYLVDRNGQHHLLRPFLLRTECPTCHAWATFYLDQTARSGTDCRVKAMEHGHTIDTIDSSAFRIVGLIGETDPPLPG